MRNSKKNEWDFCNTNEEIIEKYGMEFFKKLEKTAAFQKRLNSKLTQEEKIKLATDFIIYGPGVN